MKHSVARILILLLFSVMIAGCGDKTVIPKKGDFSFSVPEGYSIENITDTQCDILQDNGSVIGGIAITDLKLKDLKDKNTKNVMHFLQTSFHKTNDVEFFAMNFGKTHPAVSVNITAHYEDSTASNYIHYFFEKDLGVYHLWFDLDVAEQGIQLDFKSIWSTE